MERTIDTPSFPIPQTLEQAVTLSQRVAYLLSINQDSLLALTPVLSMLEIDLIVVLETAFKEEDPVALLEVHKTLYQIYEVSLCHPLSPARQHEYSPWLLTIRHRIETAWLNYELLRVVDQLPSKHQSERTESLSAWFIEQAHKESDIDLYVLNFIRTQATVEDFNLFLLSEATLAYRFFDALALAQPCSSERVKTEIARNMWDECGRGTAQNLHTSQFTRMLTALDLERPKFPIWEDWRPYAGYNLYFCFALNKKHYFKGLGSLAMPELFDPNRNRAIITGLERLYPDAPTKCEYFYSHVEAEEEHGSNWLTHVIVPTVEMQPEVGIELALGGVLRMEAMRRYNKYLALTFGLLI